MSRMRGRLSAVFDLHCDTPYFLAKKEIRHIRPQRLYGQGYKGIVFAHFVYPKAKYPFVDAVKMITSTIEYVREKETLHLTTMYREMLPGRVNVVLGAEGGHIYDTVFEQVEALYGLGLRVFTITWNNSNRLAHSALDDDKKGLTKKGREYIRRLRKYDVILDMSHASTRTVLDVCRLCENPVIASHSCIRVLNPSFLRNISDPAIKAICERGGVVAVNFSKYHLGKYSVVDHLDYLCEKYGIRHAAVGSDFDGINDPVIPGPGGITRVEKALLAKGYKKTDIQRIFSGNFLRVFRKL
ncbi:MAG: dipeptidase [candidate division WOR-3 bacterium]|nr:MAG: dipeptidase [candidate division WOR-3 bacterium]